jgi:TrmH family RNA methyltransferase
MLSKNEVKFLRSLQQNKYRKRLGLFLAEGNINVSEFLQGPLQVEKVFALQEWLDSHAKVLAGVTCQAVSRQEMAKITALKNPSEVLAVVKRPVYPLPDVSSLAEYVLALDDIRDPGNLGTIIRTADWFGIRHVVCSTKTVEAFNPKVVQATMGSLARVRVHYTELQEWLSGKPDSLPVYGAVLQGDDIRRVKKAGKGILLIGSEAHGISPELSPLIDFPVRIPSGKNAGAESLNAAVAAGIVCYAFVDK